MATITKIEINGFKAFPKQFILDLLDGRNLLVYGENGSGKSSIYYALHALLQSAFKDDFGAKYFTADDRTNNQHLVNINRVQDVIDSGFRPQIKVTFDDGHDCTLNRDGLYHSSGSLSPIELLNKGSAFINHSYISRFHAARNSEEIDLWNVFYKDILPFWLPPYSTEYLSETYDNIITLCTSERKPRKNDSALLSLINGFNNSLKQLVETINQNASRLYNMFLKDEDDKNLSVKVVFIEDTNPENIYKEHFFFRYEGANSTINPPKIGLQIKENDHEIEKPQTYFNEAKQTAIALSVRFACLSQYPEPGSFLALDDMLISLDMSNRNRVLRYLLELNNRFKIYIFTHDRAFFELMKDRISFQAEVKDKWLFKEMYYNEEIDDEPICIESKDFYTKAIYHYQNNDYPASANYLRKTVEDSMSLFPRYISKNPDGSPKDKLRTILNSAKAFLLKTDGYTDDIDTIILSIGTLLNPLSHRSIDTNVYRNELLSVIRMIPILKKHVTRLAAKEILALTNIIYLHINENETTNCEIKIELLDPLYSYNHYDGTRKFSKANGKTIESITIKDGARQLPQKFEYYKNDEIEEICKKIYQKIGATYENNYTELYYKDGKMLAELI